MTTTPAKATPTCPAWCDDHHTADPTGYHHHQSSGILPTRGLYGSISWLEPLTEAPPFTASEPQVCLAVRDTEMTLTVQQASDLAKVMAELEQDDAATLLRDLVAQIGGGDRG